ncbi:MAG TPA: radical SAM protein, partial [Candidatus Hodarchaeales archaeon]|nr:radical SAM protein [Candidatus Hodarchaeales archaeon]
TGTRCNISCTHCYVNSSPENDSISYLQYSTFKRFLDEALEKDFPKLEIYFTGGEPFINPEILEMLGESLKQADTTVLTNGTRVTDDMARKLRTIQNMSERKFFFRVSLDGPDEASNDSIRGEGSFKKARNGIQKLKDYGFESNIIITSMRSWPKKEAKVVEEKFVDLIVEDFAIIKGSSSLKILPPLRIGRESNRSRPYTAREMFTDTCFTEYDYKMLQCSSCRMVTEKGVWVCPILVNDERGRMSSTLTDSFVPYPMRSMACWTCRMEGMSCTN